MSSILEVARPQYETLKPTGKKYAKNGTSCRAPLSDIDLAEEAVICDTTF